MKSIANLQIVSIQKIKFKSVQLISGLTIVVTLAGLFVHFTKI